MAEFVLAHSAEIQKAADRIRGYVRRTPTLRTGLDPELRLTAECWPTGALPLAAYLAGKLPGGAKTGLILSGGNANLETVAKLLGTQ
jgi:threonine dehydratase